MRTSSERARDYSRDLPITAPDYLKDWAEARPWKNAILFKAGWVRDPITGMRERAADCVCTACGSHFWEDWVNGAMCNGVGYGIRLADEGVINNYGGCHCPDCGAEVKLMHLSGNTEYYEEEAWPLTLHRIPERGKKDRLALICWQVVKLFTKEGQRRIYCKPWEAFIAEEKIMRRCSRHAGGMYGKIYYHGWEQTAHCRETMGPIIDVVCPEGVAKATEGTTCENAKLELYLRNGAITFPTAWVKLWQKRGGKAESLLTCGAGEIVGNLIGQEKTEATGYYRQYNTTWPTLPELDWKGRRPWEILRLRGKDELREAKAIMGADNIGGQTLRLWMAARANGKNWDLADLKALEAMKLKLRWASGREKPAKGAAYLEAQKRRWPSDRADEIMLLDYWHMAEKEQLDLTEKAMRWPDRLLREHDRLSGQQKTKAAEAENERFRKRARELEALIYHRDGIFIRPPVSSAELVREGEILHHCVGGYATRHGRGETTILFIRREEKPDEPWYTLNLDTDGKTVIQNRGLRNCDRTPEIEAFEAAWLAWVRAGAKRDRNGEPAEPGTMNEHKKEAAA